MEVGKDEQLLEKARRAEPEALATLCSAYYPKVLRYMHYRVGAASAADLAGEVFLRVLRGIHGQKGSFLAWLYRIAANVVSDYGRKKQTRRETQMSESVHENPASESGPAETVGRQLDLRQAITKLTDAQRDLVTLKFVQGLDNEEISEITGRKPVAVRALQFRALSSLRNLLGDKESLL